MINTVINREATIKVAKALADLDRQVVFVGGAVVSLYVDNNLAEDVRPTKDLDLNFQITGIADLEMLRQELVARNFKQSVDEDVICRFVYDDLLVDVMSTEPVGWAPSNRWYQPGFNNAIEVDLKEVKIKLMPFPYFLASKLDALFDRGIKDMFASKDLEDIVYLLNYATTIIDEVKNGNLTVRRFIAEAITKMLEDDNIMYAIEAHIYPPSDDDIMAHIKEIMQELSDII